MTLIYRVETEYGTGPYVSYDSAWLQTIVGKELAKTHPSPSASGLGYTKHTEIFGFETITDLLSWFSGEDTIRALEADGYGVRVYDVPDKHITYGLQQLKFPRDAAGGLYFESISKLYFERQTYEVDNTDHEM